MRGLQATLPGNWGRLAVAVMFLFDWRFNVTLHPRGGCWLSTVYKRPGSEAIDLRGKRSGNAQVVLWDRSARSPGGPGQAGPRCDAVYIWYAKKQIHRFFIGVLGFRSRRVQGEMPFRSGSGFSKTGNRGVGFQTERFHAVFLLNGGWEEEICGAQEGRPLYPWQIHYVTVPFKVSAILFSAGVLRVDCPFMYDS